MEEDLQVPVPKGYALVKQAELNQCIDQIKNLQREVNRFTENRSNMNTEMNEMIIKVIKENIKSNVNMPNRPAPSSDDLVAMIERKCKNSTLRSKVENVKSRCTNNLKKSLIEISSKQKDSKKNLRTRFEDGQKEMAQIYQSELMASFQNKSSLNNSLPVEQYSCDELVNTYRDCMKGVLLPTMDAMYRSHCQKIDNSLKEWVNKYTANALQPSHNSPAVQQKLRQVHLRIDQISQAAQAGVFERKLDGTLEKITTELAEFQMSTRGNQPTAEEQIEEALEREDYHVALNHALVALNLDLLIQTCQRMSVDELFQDPPDQAILLAVLNQMPNNLDENMQIKSEYLMETIQSLDLASEVIATHRDYVEQELRKLITNIDEIRQHIPLRDYNQYLKQLRWATQQVVRQF